jgi:hypothetical protein
MNETTKQYASARQFFTEHGEAVLNFDDPRVTTTTAPSRQEIINSL